MSSGASLRRRLTWYVIVTLVLMTAISGFAVYKGTRGEADEIFGSALVQTARILDSQVSRASIESNRKQLQQAMEGSPQFRDYGRNLFFAVFDPEGEMLLGSSTAPNIKNRVIARGFSEFSSNHKKWFIYALQSRHDDLLIVVGERSNYRDEITEYIGKGLFLPLIVLLPFFLWILWHLVGVALKPLEDVAEQVRQQDLRQLKTVAADGVPREIDSLVNALNRMIVNLDAAYARERRFVSDASHELRNPLASLLINVDNAIEESRDEGARESLESMKTSIRRLSHLVSQLLELSHFENPLSSRTLGQVDLCRVCRQVIESFESRSAQRGYDIEMLLPSEGCDIRGDESLLSSLVTNLLDNAAKYGGADVHIRVRCERQANGVLLEVEDSGAGLDAEQRAQALERFYRAADTNTAGAGLGLSIVKTIADIHDAGLELAESELGGLAVRIRFDND